MYCYKDVQKQKTLQIKPKNIPNLSGLIMKQRKINEVKIKSSAIKQPINIHSLPKNKNIRLLESSFSDISLCQYLQSKYRE